MAKVRRCAILWVAALSGAASARGAEEVTLREASPSGKVTHALLEMKAEGLYRPGTPETGEDPPKPIKLRVETRLDCVERVVKAGPDGGGAPRRVVRHVVQAAAAINGEGAFRPTASALRPEVSLLVAEIRDGAPFAFSPGGPMTRAELELVQGPCDPLALSGMLPAKPVAVGARWPIGAEAVRALSGYDALAANTLTATLEAADESSARVRFKGEVRGAVLGGEGTIRCEGAFTFDRRAGLLDHLTVERTEDRKPGPVEAGLDVKSTLTLDRRVAEVPPELSDAVLGKVPTEPSEALDLLLLSPPDGKYTLYHDRDWHTFAEDTRRVVLKRLDHGEVVAQCNLAVGPNAGKGRHQDLKQFRDDIRSALGKRFVRFVGAGEVEGAAAGGFRYKVVVQGREGDIGVIWIYYLVASPEGDQSLATFTLGESQLKAFADRDLQMIGSLEWKAEVPAPRP
jgi:hypothetical protein